MKTTTHNKSLIQQVVSGIVLVAAGLVLAADTATSGDWLVERLEGGSLVTVTPRGSAITVKFAEQTSPPTQMDADILVGGASPTRVFRGNLSEGYSGIRFRITGNGAQPGEWALLLRTTNNEVWQFHSQENPVMRVSPKPGDPVIIDVPLRRDAGWRYLGRGQSDERWLEALRDVDALIVSLSPSQLREQAYSLSDFRLMGPGVITDPANLTPLRQHFGVDSLDDLSPVQLAALKSRDTDGDGMSDYEEILAGFDPQSAASVFAARVEVGNGKNTISWEGVLGKTYAIWRSNELRGGFVSIAAGIVCEASGVMTYVDESPIAGAANFYKVVNY